MLDKPLLRLPDVCNLIGMSKTSVYRLVHQGELPQGFLIGGSRRWSREVVTEWLQRKISKTK